MWRSLPRSACYFVDDKFALDGIDIRPTDICILAISNHIITDSVCRQLATRVNQCYFIFDSIVDCGIESRPDLGFILSKKMSVATFYDALIMLSKKEVKCRYLSEKDRSILNMLAAGIDVASIAEYSGSNGKTVYAQKRAAMLKFGFSRCGPHSINLLNMVRYYCRHFKNII